MDRLAIFCRIVFGAFLTGSSFAIAQTSGFRGIGILPGFDGSNFGSLSANGVFACGTSFRADGTQEGFRSSARRQDPVGWFAGSQTVSRAVGLSDDGGTTLVTAIRGTSIQTGAFGAGLWTGNLQDLGPMPGTSSVYSKSISQTGDRVFGQASVGGGLYPPKTFAWNPQSGFQTIDLGDSSQFSLYAVSTDGKTLVGSSQYGATSYSHGKFSSLSASPNSVALAVSGNGQVVGGSVSAPDYSSTFATLWTQHGTQTLGDLPGGLDFSQVLGVTRDGKYAVGVGSTYNYVFDPYQGFIDIGQNDGFVWSSDLGMLPVEQFMGERGITVPAGWTLSDADSVTMNQGTLTIGGNGIDPLGRNQGWVASVQLSAGPVPEPAGWQVLAVGALAGLWGRRRKA